MPAVDPATPHYRPLVPDDPDAARREERLRALGLHDRPDPQFDSFAADLARRAAALVGLPAEPYAMVNLMTGDRQYFTGLHTPPAGDGGSLLDRTTPAPPVEQRTMTRAQGWCPHVVSRGKALVLDDVCEWPRFGRNEVVDLVGIRTYLGAPLIDPETGIALGTVCVVDTDVRPWGRPGLEFIKARAQEALDLVLSRAAP